MTPRTAARSAGHATVDRRRVRIRGRADSVGGMSEPTTVDDVHLALHDRSGQSAVVNIEVGEEPEVGVLTTQGILRPWSADNALADHVDDGLRHEMVGTFELIDGRGWRVASFEVRHDAITDIKHASDHNGDRYELRHFNGMMMIVVFPPD